jgi:hypothetical protein
VPNKLTNLQKKWIEEEESAANAASMKDSLHF